MLLNLLTNAVKYTESGHVRLVATLLPSAALDAPGRSVPPNEVLIRFAVEDTGCGIPTELAGGKLFAAFERGSQLKGDATSPATPSVPAHRPSARPPPLEAPGPFSPEASGGVGRAARRRPEHTPFLCTPTGRARSRAPASACRCATSC